MNNSTFIQIFNVSKRFGKGCFHWPFHPHIVPYKLHNIYIIPNPCLACFQVLSSATQCPFHHLACNLQLADSSRPWWYILKWVAIRTHFHDPFSCLHMYKVINHGQIADNNKDDSNYVWRHMLMFHVNVKLLACTVYLFAYILQFQQIRSS